jgi:hypothetical protein
MATPRRQTCRRQNYKLKPLPLTLGSSTFETPTLKQAHSLALFEHQLKANDFTLSSPTFTPPEQAPVATTPVSVERWRKPWPEYKVKAAARAVAETCNPDDPPTAAEWKTALEKHFGGPVTRKIARGALRRFALHLLRKPGGKRNRRT